MLKKKIKGGLPSQLISIRARLALAGALAAIASGSQLNAATRYWINGSGDFSDPTHFSGGLVPTAGDVVVMADTNAVATITSNAVSNTFLVGYQAGAGSDTLNIAGGTLTTGGLSLYGHSGGGAINITGGVVDVSGAFRVGADGAGGYVSTVNMSGGTVKVSGVASSFSVGAFALSNAVFNLTDTGSIVSGPTGTGIVNVGNSTPGGAILNMGTGGVAGTIAAGTIASSVGTINFNHTNSVTISAAITGSATINKLASGMTTFTGVNTYSGTTSVSAGALFVNNASGSGTGTSAVSVADLATLGGSGTITGSLIANGIIAPGALNAIGTLTVGGSVTWNGQIADAWTFDLGSGGVSDKLAITGALTKGTGTQYVFDFLGGGSVGSYTLATFGSSTFASSDFGSKNLGDGLTVSFTKSATDLIAVVTLTPVPEPATVAAIAGAVVLGFVVVRRRKTVAA